MSSQRPHTNSGPVTIRLEVPDPAPASAPAAAAAHESAHLSEPFSSILEEIACELELRPLLTSIITRACGLLGADDGAIGLEHTWSAPGDVTITVTVTDDDGGTGTVGTAVTVSSADG